MVFIYRDIINEITPFRLFWNCWF